MIVFPNAKINLGLKVTEKRPDGFHSIETIFYPIQWCDILEVLEGNATSFTSEGINIPGDPDSNLCLKAYKLLKEDFDLPPIRIHLNKQIPIGAGLGGGSSDASHTLVAINQLFNLKITDNQLIEYAKKLGSDCPFFIKNTPVYAHGTGTEFEEIPPFKLEGYIVLIYPSIHISSGEAYSGIQPQQNSTDLKKLISAPANWKSLLVNDFEPHIFHNHPILRKIKETLYAKGAYYASMSGSGSTVFGLFQELPKLSFPNMVIKQIAFE